MRRVFLTFVFVSSFLSACASDPVAIGGACVDVGKTDECVDSAICTNDSAGKYCRKVCTDQAQCSATESCSGIAGTTVKSCQPAKK